MIRSVHLQAAVLASAFIVPLGFAGPALSQTLNFSTLDNPTSSVGTLLTGINVAGQIVGIVRQSDQTARGFIYNAGTFSTLFPAVNSTATDINNSGQITGDYLNGRIFNGYLYTNGSLQLFNPPNGINGSGGEGINDSGQVVGDFANGAINEGFLYDNGSITAPINLCQDTKLMDINDSGILVGNCSAAEYSFIFDPSTNSLSTFVYPGASAMFAEKINNFGQVAGYYTDTTGNHGFVYANGTFTPIDYPGIEGNTFVRGMNDNGSIVGYYILNGVEHGFVAEAPVFAGKPDDPDCHGDSVSALAQQYGKLPSAATALGYRSVQALQMAITAHCRG